MQNKFTNFHKTNTLTLLYYNLSILVKILLSKLIKRTKKLDAFQRIVKSKYLQIFLQKTLHLKTNFLAFITSLK